MSIIENKTYALIEHYRTEYGLYCSTIEVDAVIKTAKQYGMEAADKMLDSILELG